MAGVGEGDDALGFEDAFKDVLKLEHGEGGCAHIVGLCIGGEEVDIARVVWVGSTVPGNVDNDGVLLLWLGEEVEQGVADGFGGCVLVEEEQRVLVGHAAARRGFEKVQHGPGITVGVLKIVDLLCATFGVVRDSNHHRK